MLEAGDTVVSKTVKLLLPFLDFIVYSWFYSLVFHLHGPREGLKVQRKWLKVQTEKHLANCHCLNLAVIERKSEKDDNGLYPTDEQSPLFILHSFILNIFTRGFFTPSIALVTPTKQGGTESSYGTLWCSQSSVRNK